MSVFVLVQRYGRDELPAFGRQRLASADQQSKKRIRQGTDKNPDDVRGHESAPSVVSLRPGNRRPNLHIGFDSRLGEMAGKAAAHAAPRGKGDKVGFECDTARFEQQHDRAAAWTDRLLDRTAMREVTGRQSLCVFIAPDAIALHDLADHERCDFDHRDDSNATAAIDIGVDQRDHSAVLGVRRDGDDRGRIARVKRSVDFVKIDHRSADRQLVVMVFIGRQAKNRPVSSSKR